LKELNKPLAIKPIKKSDILFKKIDVDVNNDNQNKMDNNLKYEKINKKGEAKQILDNKSNSFIYKVYFADKLTLLGYLLSIYVIVLIVVFIMLFMLNHLLCKNPTYKQLFSSYSFFLYKKIILQQSLVIQVQD